MSKWLANFTVILGNSSAMPSGPFCTEHGSAKESLKSMQLPPGNNYNAKKALDGTNGIPVNEVNLYHRPALPQGYSCQKNISQLQEQPRMEVGLHMRCSKSKPQGAWSCGQRKLLLSQALKMQLPKARAT